MAFPSTFTNDMLKPFWISRASTSFASSNSIHSPIPSPLAPSAQAVSGIPSKRESAPNPALGNTPQKVYPGAASAREEEAPFTETKSCAGALGRSRVLGVSNQIALKYDCSTDAS